MSTRAGPKKLQYEPETVEERLGHLVEACGAVLRAAGKSIRWGLDSTNPELPLSEQEMNRDWLKREMRDLRAVIKRIFDVLGEHKVSTRAGPKKPEYEPETVEERLGYLVEECGEVLEAAGKSIRCGLDSANPALPPSEQEMNRDWLKREMRDLRVSISRMFEVLP